jgi:hypothetical protein
MTVEANPFALQSDTYSAEITRRAIYASLQRGATIGSVVGGLVAPSDCQVTYAGSGLKLTVATGEAYVPGSTSATQSAYYTRVSAAETLTLSAASPSAPRIERISLVIKDASYSGAESLGEVKVSEGVASAGATLNNLTGVAAAPASSLTLAYVLVPQSATTISNSEIRNVSAPVALGLNAWQLVEGSSTITAADSQLVKATGALTVTSPAAGKGVTFAVLANNQAVKIKAAAGLIYGDFLTGVSECSLVGYQHLQLISDGTNWFIVAGEPKRTETYAAKKGYSRAEMEAGVTPSATTRVMVLFSFSEGSGKVKVEGVELLLPSTSEGRCFPVNPGQVVTANVGCSMQFLVG